MGRGVRKARAPHGASRFRQPYSLPEQVWADRPQEVAKIKKLAARCGRTYYEPAKHEQARAKLAEAVAGLDHCALDYWAHVMMIDTRWCGATGTGAYWAVASRCVNEIALAEMLRRSKAWRQEHGDAMFVVVEEC